MLYNSDFKIQKERVLSTCNCSKGIGTLSEKTLHKIIKFTVNDDESTHEIKIGKFYADCFFNKTVFEIQTRAFNKLREKLDYFLKIYKTNIIYPIPYKKNIFWVNEQTKEITEIRKSPKTGSIYDAILELYKIKPFLKNSNLSITFVFLNIDEYRYLNGWSKNRKKGSTRIDRIPTELVNLITIENILDYSIFLPLDLPRQFTNKDLSNIAKINLRKASVCTNILCSLNIIKIIEKKGRSILYEKA